MDVAKMIGDEAGMKARGVERYRKARAKAAEKHRPSTMGGQRSLLKVLVPVLGAGIKGYTSLKRKGKPGKGAAAKPLLRALDAKVVAMITVRTVFDSISSRKALTAIAYNVGRRVEDEARFRHFKKGNARKYRSVIKRVERSMDYQYKRRVLVHAMNKEVNVKPWEAWSKKQRLQLGAVLIDLMITTGAIETLTVPAMGGKQKYTVLRLTTKTMADIEDADEFLEGLTPWYLPCTQLPRAWTDPAHGGYHSWKMYLVKERGDHSRKPLLGADMPLVYEGLNRIQATPWRINTDVLAVLGDVWHQQHAVAGIPSREGVVIPPRPEGIPHGVASADLTEEQGELLDSWKSEKSAAIAGAVRRESKLLAIRQIMEVGRMFSKEEAIYFPHQLDWRSRAYAVPLYLTPQGSDVARGLLLFSEAKAINEEAAWNWYLIHGANCFGYDKVTLDARRVWTMEATDRIKEVASDPLTHTWWQEASKPFQFLAWCLEYGAWLETEGQLLLMSRIPVAMDGTCNGLQHFSAMLRDKEGGEAVNLTNTDVPQDVYARVAAVVQRRAEVDAHSPLRAVTQVAREWLDSGLITREIVKRQVMTLPYGATRHGMADQLRAYLGKLTEKQGELPFEDEWMAGLYLTELIYESIGTVVSAPREAMMFLQACAKVAASKGAAIKWVTPLGFPVVQRYNNTSRLTVKTQLLGQMTLHLRVGMPALDKRKQESGISPNFVHSMDASHMFATVCAMPSGVSYGMVHDSYATHACDAPLLASTLREQFVIMYEEQCVLARFKSDLSKQLRCGLPEVPAKGVLDVREVMESAFFFA